MSIQTDPSSKFTKDSLRDSNELFKSMNSKCKKKSIEIPMQSTKGEVVEIFYDDLPLDSREVSEILAGENAPLRYYIILAIEYHSRSMDSAAISILEAGLALLSDSQKASNNLLESVSEVYGMLASIYILFSLDIDKRSKNAPVEYLSSPSAFLALVNQYLLYAEQKCSATDLDFYLRRGSALLCNQNQYPNNLQTSVPSDFSSSSTSLEAAEYQFKIVEQRYGKNLALLIGQLQMFIIRGNAKMVLKTAQEIILNFPTAFKHRMRLIICRAYYALGFLKFSFNALEVLIAELEKKRPKQHKDTLFYSVLNEAYIFRGIILLNQASVSSSNNALEIFRSLYMPLSKIQTLGSPVAYNHSLSLLHLANYCINMGKPFENASALLNAIKADPTVHSPYLCSEVIFLKAKITHLTGDLEAAIKEYIDAIKFNSDFIPARFALCQAKLARDGKKVDYRQILSELKTFPNLSNFYIYDRLINLVSFQCRPQQTFYIDINRNISSFQKTSPSPISDAFIGSFVYLRENTAILSLENLFKLLASLNDTEVSDTSYILALVEFNLAAQLILVDPFRALELLKPNILDEKIGALKLSNRVALAYNRSLALFSSGDIKGSIDSLRSILNTFPDFYQGKFCGLYF